MSTQHAESMLCMHPLKRIACIACHTSWEWHLTMVTLLTDGDLMLCFPCCAYLHMTLLQARHVGGDQAAGQTPGKAAAAAGSRMPLAPAGPQQQLPAGDSKGRSTGAARKKPAPLPKVSKGC